MKTTNPTTTPTSPAKRRLAKAITVGLVGALLLTATGTLGGWRDTAQIAAPDTAITAGSLTFEASATSAWTLNGTAVPENELSAVNLVPGDVLAYVGSHTPNLTGDMQAWMYFTGVEAITGELSESPAASQTWSVAGKQEAKKITSADSGTGVATGYEIRMAPIGDPVYATGTEGEALVLDVSRVKVVLSMVNPGGGGSTPEPPVEGEDPSATWVINDPTVRQAVLDELGIQEASELKADDKELLTSLQFESTETTSLADIKAMTSLTKLRLDHTGQGMERVLSTLGTAPQVKELEFYGYYIEDENGLAGLAGLTGLEKLYANGVGKTATLAPLAGLESLKDAKIHNADFITDLTPLAGLNLTSLDISSAVSLTDLAPLSGMRSLTSLKLTSMSSLSDLTPLRSLSGLKSLDVSGSNEVSDISAISNMTGLQALKLSGTDQLTDIEAISGLTGLRELRIIAVGLTDLTPISGLTSLKELDLHPSWTVTDIGALEPLTSLEKLDLSASELTDLGPLAGMTSMRELTLDTSASDLTALSGMMRLEELNIRSSETRREGEMNGWSLEELLQNHPLSLGITSLDPLRHLESLRDFSIEGGSFDDVTPLSQLPRLFSASFSGTWVEDTSSLDHIPMVDVS